MRVRLGIIVLTCRMNSAEVHLDGFNGVWVLQFHFSNDSDRVSCFAAIINACYQVCALN